MPKRKAKRAKTSLLELEEPIADLRDSIGALLAIGPHFAVGEAGILWIASKMHESATLLQERWRVLLTHERRKSARR